MNLSNKIGVGFSLILAWFLLAATGLAADKEALTLQQNQASSGTVTATIAQSQAASPSAGEQIKWQVIAAGGTRGTSTNYVLFGTAGQTAVGKGTSTNFQVNQGFWQSFGAACDDCGDANSDGTVDISDAVFLIAYIFAGGSAPGECVTPNGMGDANGDETVDISDAVYLIAYIFASGPAPHCP